jgi:hypothetical protein
MLLDLKAGGRTVGMSTAGISHVEAWMVYAGTSGG